MSYVKTKEGAKIYVYRANTENASLSATEYLPESQFGLGINEVAPTISDTTLTQPIPIFDGVINDNGENTLTGSAGGTNSTLNTTTFKPGASQVDNSAQNLIANDTSGVKTWTISNLATAGVNCDEDKHIGFWLYFRNQDTLDKLQPADTVLQARIGSDVSGTNFYYKTWTKAQLSVGWNWVSTNDILSTWSELDAPGTLSQFRINIYTVNATDTFAEGDVIYDLLRQWTTTELYKDYVTNYPLIDLTNLEVTKQGYLNSLEAVGFNITGYGDFNKDTTIKMTNKTNIKSRSKADTDEFIFINKDRIIL